MWILWSFEQASIIGQGCVLVCTKLRENVISIMEFEGNTNAGYLECLQKYNVKLDTNNEKPRKKK